MDDEQRKQPLALAVRWLLALGDGRRATLAARSGISVSTIRRYEKGEYTPRRRDLEALAVGAELPVALEEFVSWCQAMCGAAPAPEVAGNHRAYPLESATAKLAKAVALPELLPGRPSAADREGAAERAQRLLTASPEERRWLLDETLEYRSWAVAEEVCLESRRKAADEPKEALELAELALAIAELTPGEPALGWRVQGLALFTLANAWRVGGHLPEAREKWNEGRKLWLAGEGADPGFDENQVRSLEISLLISERKLGEALRLADLALKHARGELVVDIHLQKARARELMGEYREAIGLLRVVEPSLGEATEPRKLWLQRYALMSNFCHLGQAEEAARFLVEIRQLTASLGNAMDQTRLNGLEGRIAAGMGKWEEAACLLEVGPRVFAAAGMLYDMALTTLELAAVYLEMGRSQEVKELAAGLVPVFEKQGVPEEARKALPLFCQAAEQEIATAELARQIVTFLYRAQGDSELRFELPR